MPSPTAPAISGSVGLPHRGVLTGPSALDRVGSGYRLLRHNDRHYGLPRFVRVIERAAARVAADRPGAVLTIGDLSSARGGELLPHFSHRSGRDADLLFYVTTLDGAPVDSPGFIHFSPDGLAFDDKTHRYLRLDVEREWLLVRTLLQDEEARVQWIFVSRVVGAMLLDWARARGEPTELLYRALEVMAQPDPGGVHDDHLHVRTACDDDDVARGCEPFGPSRPWHGSPMPQPPPGPGDERELVLELLRPLDAETPLPVATRN